MGKIFSKECKYKSNEFLKQTSKFNNLINIRYLNLWSKALYFLVWKVSYIYYQDIHDIYDQGYWKYEKESIKNKYYVSRNCFLIKKNYQFIDTCELYYI